MIWKALLNVFIKAADPGGITSQDFILIFLLFFPWKNSGEGWIEDNQDVQQNNKAREGLEARQN